MEEQFAVFLATIWGEAAGCSRDSWRAIASVILNRVGVREWRKLKTPLRVISGSGFDAFSQRNKPYVTAETYFRDWNPGNMIPRNDRLESLYHAVYLIYYGREARTTDAVLYYSPKAQAQLHAMNPSLYRAPVPRWNFDLLEEVPIEGAEKDDFKFFRYKERPVA